MHHLASLFHYVLLRWEAASTASDSNEEVLVKQPWTVLVVFVQRRFRFLGLLQCGVLATYPQGQNQQCLRAQLVQKLCSFKAQSGPHPSFFFSFLISAGGLSVPVTNSLSVAHGCHSRGGALKVKYGHTLKTVHFILYENCM